MKIKRLKIFSSNIKSQLKFYRDELNFEISNYSEKSFEIQLGYSVLIFEYRENATPYHIALHIPDEKEEEALDWTEYNIGALRNNGEKIIDFSAWKARSVYFYDEDRNIMEFISRRDFSKPKTAIFTPESILGIAEIGLVTDDVKAKFDKLHRECGLEKYDGDFDRFCAIGEDQGLIITINKHKKDWFPTSDKAFPSAFEMEFEHSGAHFSLGYENNNLEIQKYQ